MESNYPAATLSQLRLRYDQTDCLQKKDNFVTRVILENLFTSGLQMTVITTKHSDILAQITQAERNLLNVFKI